MPRPACLRFAPALAAALAACPARADQSGLPQLDPSFYPGEIFWLAVCFGVLYLLMARVALPGVTATKHNRKEAIASELAAARAASDAAKDAAEKVEKSLSEARAAAQARVNGLVAEGAAQAAERRAAQEKDIMRRLHSAEADIAVARETALKAVAGQAAELAALIAGRIVGARKRDAA